MLVVLVILTNQPEMLLEPVDVCNVAVSDCLVITEEHVGQLVSGGFIDSKPNVLLVTMDGRATWTSSVFSSNHCKSVITSSPLSTASCTTLVCLRQAKVHTPQHNFPALAATTPKSKGPHSTNIWLGVLNGIMY